MPAILFQNSVSLVIRLLITFVISIYQLEFDWLLLQTYCSLQIALKHYLISAYDSFYAYKKRSHFMVVIDDSLRFSHFIEQNYFIVLCNKTVSFTEKFSLVFIVCKRFKKHLFGNILSIFL